MTNTICAAFCSFIVNDFLNLTYEKSGKDTVFLSLLRLCIMFDYVIHVLCIKKEVSCIIQVFCEINTEELESFTDI